jgi:hypothetical protein
MLKNDLWKRRKIFRKWIKVERRGPIFDKFRIRSGFARAQIKRKKLGK